MTPAKSRERLLKLADLLDSLPVKRFDYGTWVGESWEGKSDLSCGTTACALGWATTIPEFRRAGLKLVSAFIPYVVYRDYHESIAAGAAFFGISHDHSLLLFLPGSMGYVNGKSLLAPGDNAKPKTVAKHIRRFVALALKVAA